MSSLIRKATSWTVLNSWLEVLQLHYFQMFHQKKIMRPSKVDLFFFFSIWSLHFFSTICEPKSSCCYVACLVGQTNFISVFPKPGSNMCSLYKGVPYILHRLYVGLLGHPLFSRLSVVNIFSGVEESMQRTCILVLSSLSKWVLTLSFCSSLKLYPISAFC